MNLLVPSSVMLSGGVTQFVVVRLVFCCKVQPVDGDGQETHTVLVVVSAMARAGAPGAGEMPG